MTDGAILDRLFELDNDDAVRMSSRDSEFMESMMRLREENPDAELSPGRRKWAIDIIERYGRGA